MTSSLTNAEKREAFLAGAFATYDTLAAIGNLVGPVAVRDKLNAEALRRYPDPKEPTIVTGLNGYQWRFCQGHLEWRDETHGSWKTDYELTPSLVLTLAEIAQEYLDQENR